MSDPGWWGVVIVLSLITAWCLYKNQRPKH